MAPIDDIHLNVISQSFGCDYATAHAIAVSAIVRHFPAHSVITRAGDRDTGAWLMLHGEAQVLAYGPNGHYILVHSFSAGDLFGEAAGLSLAASAGEVSAVGEVDAGHYSASLFVGLMESYSCVALSVTRGLINRLRQTTRRLIEGATLSAIGRIHAELLRQAREGEAMTIRPTPVHAAFALQVQTSRETVSRTIIALERRGIIKRSGGGLTVVAPHRLEELIY